MGPPTWVWLANTRDVKNIPGRPEIDKLDAIWQVKLDQRGRLRPSFVPPREIRELGDSTRLRAELVEERSRHSRMARGGRPQTGPRRLPGGTSTSASARGRCRRDSPAGPARMST